MSDELKAATEIAKEPRWQIGDVLYRSVGGSFPRVFIATALPDSATFGDGCYSPKDRGETRKATIVDVLKCIEMQRDHVHREWHQLNDLIVMMRKVALADLSVQERGELQAYRILDAAGMIHRERNDVQ